MPRTSVASQALASPCQSPWYPADLLPQLQSTLAVLADIEVQYQHSQEQLRAWAGPEAAKRQFTAQLADRYRQEREPYLQRLEELQRSMSRILPLQ